MINTRNILLFSSMIILSSCSVGRKSETVIYTLRPDAASVIRQNCNQKLNLQIVEPTIVTGLETRRIAILQKDNHMNYYKGVRWAAPVPEMFKTALIDAFEKVPVFNSVGTDMDDISSEYVLTTDIRDFQVNEEMGSPFTQIRFVSKLISTKDHKIIATIPVESNITPAVHKMDNIIAAFDSSLSTSIAEVINKSAEVLPSCSLKQEPYEKHRNK
jgi:cholesterol transport system auxiliary component